MVQALKEIIEALYVGIESLLLDIGYAKQGYRNLFVFLNENVIRVAKQNSATGTPEIENCKNHLAKLVSNKEILLQLFANKNSFYMSKVSEHFDSKNDESSQFIQNNIGHYIQDNLTGLIYQKPLLIGETKGTFQKTDLQIPLPIEFLSEYKPISGLKSILVTVKHLFETLYCNPLKTFSQYLSIENTHIVKNGPIKLKIFDITPVYNENIDYYLLAHIAFSSILDRLFKK